MAGRTHALKLEQAVKVEQFALRERAIAR